jgi:ribosome biogenesis GTPase
MGVVVAQIPRESELCRPDSQGKLKPVAANIDQIIVVIAPYPEPHRNLIDRYLIAAEATRIEPVLLLNKTDLLTKDEALKQSIEALLSSYTKLGYRTIQTSCKDGGTVELKAALEAKISVFVGQSGVGKSSLVNMLIPKADLAVGALSVNTQKGTHTTTAAHLSHLNCDGSLIDSPGIREFGLWHLSKEEVEQGFREFRPFLGHCKFRDCQHQQEPECAILAAVANGEISAERMASYRHIIGAMEAL